MKALLLPSAVIVDSTQSQTIIRVRVPGEVQPISLTLNESHTAQDLYQAVEASVESGFWELRTLSISKQGTDKNGHKDDSRS